MAMGVATGVAVTCHVGEPQSGKTGVLVDRAMQLASLHDGAVLVCAGSKAGQADLQKRIEAKIDSSGLQKDPSIADIHVVLPYQIATQILSDPSVSHVTGRTARILEPFEERFLMEDMRTNQMKEKRIKAVSNFIKRGWSNLDDDDPEWLVSSEEYKVRDDLWNNLRFMGGMLRCEACNLAVHALRDIDNNVRNTFAYTHVLVDDFEQLDRSSQALVCMLASRTLDVATGTVASIAVDDRYPNPQGLEELLAEMPDAQVRRLPASTQPAAIKDALNLVAQKAHEESAWDIRQSLGAETHKEMSSGCVGDTANMALDVQIPVTMGDELRIIAQEAQKAVQAHESVLIVGTNSVWRANVARALRSCNIEIETAQGRIGIGDFRDAKSCQRAYEATLQHLRENPHDGVAWRCLIGFGDYMARSVGVEVLRDAALKNGIHIDEALEQLNEGRLVGVDAQDPRLKGVLEAYRNGLQALVAQSEEPIDIAFSSSEAGTTAATVYLCSPAQCAGRQADLVIFGGFVDGFIPQRDVFDPAVMVGSKLKQAQDTDIRSLYLVMGRACKRLLFTGFSDVTLQTAEMLKLRIMRIHIKDGVRMADTKPSALLDIFEPALRREAETVTV